jgi:hypothetical protein
MKYQIKNPIDEKGRLARLPEYFICDEPKQFDSHTYSVGFMFEYNNHTYGLVSRITSGGQTVKGTNHPSPLKSKLDYILWRFK